MGIKVGKPVVKGSRSSSRVSPYRIPSTLQSVSEVCPSAFEMPEEGGTCFRKCWCTSPPFCHLPSAPVTSVVQPSADGAAFSPPNSRQVVTEFFLAWSSYAEESERMSHGGNPAGWPLLHTQGMLLWGVSSAWESFGAES